VFCIAVIQAVASADGPNRTLDVDEQKLFASTDPTLSTTSLRRFAPSSKARLEHLSLAYSFFEESITVFVFVFVRIS